MSETSQPQTIADSSYVPMLFGQVELEDAAETCERFLIGHGPRRVDSLLATISPDARADFYGSGGAVSELEAEVASLLGKEAALFLPTGTMAQQATLRVHADARGSRKIVFHATCHLETREERGYELLHGLVGAPLGSRVEPLTADALEHVDGHVGALLLELPQRDLAGDLPDWDELRRQVAWARARGTATHLDGARLWEAAPFYDIVHGRSLSDVAALFDSVYVSFYKGLGGIAGCCVAGTADMIDELSLWRTRHGGRCFMMWPYAASALTVLRRRLPLMPDYYRHAQRIGEALKDIPGLELLPQEIRAPLLHVTLSMSLDELRARLTEVARSRSVWMFSRIFRSEGLERHRLELAVGDATLEFSPSEVAELFERLLAPA